MSKLSRRHLVTTAAALPALAIPAIADPNGPNPDAELLRLGAELDAIIVEWRAQRAIDQKQRRHGCSVEAAGLADLNREACRDDEFCAYKADARGPIYRARGE